MTLVLTYHGVGPAADPLHVDAATFTAHLDAIVEAGRPVVRVSELAARLRAGADPSGVAITFDDGFASVARVAAPLLAERGLPATVFCVAGHLGGRSDWPSAHPDAPTVDLARADELAELAGLGWEIGCHGMMHAPLLGDDGELLRRELGEARSQLEQATGAAVRALAYPYGAGPSEAARALVEATFDAACSTRLGSVGAGTDVWSLPRVDAHYVRRPRLLRAALAGTLGPYLRTRGLGARARRAVRRDFATTGDRR